MNESISNDWENIKKQLNKIMKTVQGMKVEIEAPQQTQNEIKLDMKILGSQKKPQTVSLTIRVQNTEIQGSEDRVD